MVAHACHTCSQKAETGLPQVWSQPGLYCEAALFLFLVYRWGSVSSEFMHNQDSLSHPRELPQSQGISEGRSFAEMFATDILPGGMRYTRLWAEVCCLSPAIWVAQGPPDSNFALHWPSEGLRCVETTGLLKGHAFPPPECLWDEMGLCSCLSEVNVLGRGIHFILTFLECFGNLSLGQKILLC